MREGGPAPETPNVADSCEGSASRSCSLREALLGPAPGAPSLKGRWQGATCKYESTGCREDRPCQSPCQVSSLGLCSVPMGPGSVCSHSQRI